MLDVDLIDPEGLIIAKEDQIWGGIVVLERHEDGRVRAVLYRDEHYGWEPIDSVPITDESDRTLGWAVRELVRYALVSGRMT